MAKLSEFDLIAKLFRPLVTDPNASDLKDDAALLVPPQGYDVVVTKDMLLADVHFFSDDPPHLVAKKALRANVSDLISKGAKPWRYSLGLAVPEGLEDNYLKSFTEGLAEDQAHYGLSLLGGDTTRSQAGLIISITAYGLVPAGKMVTRLNANPGDHVYVTGSLGAGAIGLQVRRDKTSFNQCPKDVLDALVGAYLLPQPPIEATSLVSRFASASMDVSDGVFGDLGQLCRASGVSCEVYLERLPLSAEVQTFLSHYPDYCENALNGGDDYQCLLSVPEKAVEELTKTAGELQVTFIGRILEKAEKPISVLENEIPSDFPASGFTHF